MKTIVAPTDFTANSINAVNFAAALAELTGSRLSILHVCPVPIAVGDSLPVNLYEELLSGAHTEMAGLEEKLSRKFEGKLLVETEIREGGTKNGLTEYCKAHDPWLVVLSATTGAWFDRFISGNQMGYAVKKLDWPVLVIPPETRFTGIYKIAFACDFENVTETVPVRQLEELVTGLGAELIVLNVTAGPGNRYTEEGMRQNKLLKDMLAHLNPKYKFIAGASIEQGIESYVRHHQVDLLIVVPKKHGFFHRLFLESTSDNLVLHAHLPVLSIHE